MHHPDTNFDYPKRELMHPTPHARFARVSDYVFQIAKYPNCHFGHLAIWQFPPIPKVLKVPKTKTKRSGICSVSLHRTPPEHNSIGTVPLALHKAVTTSHNHFPQCRTTPPPHSLRSPPTTTPKFRFLYFICVPRRFSNCHIATKLPNIQNGNLTISKTPHLSPKS